MRSETREKINRQYTYIVENIKFIYTSFDEFFLPVSQRVDMNYIFCDNTFYRGMSKAPKKLSNCLKRAETSVKTTVCGIIKVNLVYTEKMS